MNITLGLSRQEWQVTAIAALIMVLRMLGLFMLLAVLHRLNNHFPGMTSFQIGAVMGAYGIAQAVMQLPFGILSDFFGRKAMLCLGLLLFLVGSLICFFAPTAVWLIAGRMLQGMGAVGAVTLALLGEHTRPMIRTRAMAIVGISIGASFCLSFVLGPILEAIGGIQSIFGVTAMGSMVALWFAWTRLPDSMVVPSGQSLLAQEAIRSTLGQSMLWKLYYGIFCLHAVFTMSFQFIPKHIETITQLSGASVWQFYVPVFLLALVGMGPFMRNKTSAIHQRYTWLLAVALLGGAIFLIAMVENKMSLYLGAVLFFTVFNLLEALLPAAVSQVAEGRYQGTAMGFFSTAQFLGIGFGGLLGGSLYAATPLPIVGACVLFLSLWFMIMAFDKGEK